MKKLNLTIIFMLGVFLAIAQQYTDTRNGQTYQVHSVGPKQMIINMAYISPAVGVHPAYSVLEYDTNNNPVWLQNIDSSVVLYTYQQAATGQVCPDGFHVSTQQDFYDLILYYGGRSEAAANIPHSMAGFYVTANRQTMYKNKAGYYLAMNTNPDYVLFSADGTLKEHPQQTSWPVTAYFNSELQKFVKATKPDYAFRVNCSNNNTAPFVHRENLLYNFPQWANGQTFKQFFAENYPANNIQVKEQYYNYKTSAILYVKWGAIEVGAKKTIDSSKSYYISSKNQTF